MADNKNVINKNIINRSKHNDILLSRSNKKSKGDNKPLKKIMGASTVNGKGLVYLQIYATINQKTKISSVYYYRNNPDF